MRCECGRGLSDEGLILVVVLAGFKVSVLYTLSGTGLRSPVLRLLELSLDTWSVLVG
jgi:hypothetical protein